MGVPSTNRQKRVGNYQERRNRQRTKDEVRQSYQADPQRGPVTSSHDTCKEYTLFSAFANVFLFTLCVCIVGRNINYRGSMHKLIDHFIYKYVLKQNFMEIVQIFLSTMGIYFKMFNILSVETYFSPTVMELSNIHVIV